MHLWPWFGTMQGLEGALPRGVFRCCCRKHKVLSLNLQFTHNMLLMYVTQKPRVWCKFTVLLRLQMFVDKEETKVPGGWDSLDPSLSQQERTRVGEIIRVVALDGLDVLQEESPEDRRQVLYVLFLV